MDKKILEDSASIRWYGCPQCHKITHIDNTIASEMVFDKNFLQVLYEEFGDKIRSRVCPDCEAKHK